MTTLTSPYYNTNADDDTLRMPLPTTTPAHRTIDHDADRNLGNADHGYADHGWPEPGYPDHTAAVADRRPTGPTLDATKLWTGGLATAAVAALVGLVGTLVIRVLFQYAPVGTAAAHAFTSASAGLLCLFAAVAALAATGAAHLLMVSTPDPLSYLGWIIGLCTATAVVVPFVGTTALAAAVAIALVNLVIGLAIGSLVIGTAVAARRTR